jgi:hypothetical protein
MWRPVGELGQGSGTCGAHGVCLGGGAHQATNRVPEPREDREGRGEEGEADGEGLLEHELDRDDLEEALGCHVVRKWEGRGGGREGRSERESQSQVKRQKKRLTRLGTEA